MLPLTLDPRPSTLDPRPSTLDPRPSTLDPRPKPRLDVNLPLHLLWGSCQGKLYCSRDISKLQTIKLHPGKLPGEKSVTLEKFSFPRETVNKSSFPRAKVCSVTTAIVVDKLPCFLCRRNNDTFCDKVINFLFYNSMMLSVKTLGLTRCCYGTKLFLNSILTLETN